MRLPCLLLLCIALVSAQVYVSIDWTQPPIYESNIHTTLQVVVNPYDIRGSPVHDQVYAGLKALQTEMTRFVPWLPYPRLAVAQLEGPEINPQCEVVPENQIMWLQCSSGGVITSVEFASYGTATGSCGSFATSNCHLANSSAIVAAACVGQNTCTLNVSSSSFPDPCSGTSKWLAVQVHCSGQTNNTHWDFSLIDPVMEDFMSATSPRTVTINFSTTPQWMWVTPSPVAFPDDPNQVFWSYEQGSTLRDPSFTQLAAYYARLLSWYTKGGFVDETGVTHTSGLYYNISHWEVLNEIEGEHGISPEVYTGLYDAVVTAMRAVQPQLQFVGMALETHRNWQYWYYFLNHSNHAPGIPLDYTSFHFYSSSSSRTDPNTYEEFFPQADDFAEEVAQVIVIRDQLSPDTKLFIDEVGCILPDDNNPNAADFPLVYWNAASAQFAYVYGLLAPQDVSWLGMSQLVGFPTQYPSVSMVNWTSGEMTPRYWTLQMLLRYYRNGPGSVWRTYTNTAAVFAQGFANPSRTLLLVNKVNAAQTVGLTVDWTNATYQCVDETSGFNEPEVQTLTNPENLPMGPFAVCIVTYPGDNVSSS